ncbi:hypothetical protein G7054_g12238 [Neopestalotiopsis clavispora]|nr:hypothetical protein G7054_g12238 [Neopestalotiopsis clavispora]
MRLTSAAVAAILAYTAVASPMYARSTPEACEKTYDSCMAQPNADGAKCSSDFATCAGHAADHKRQDPCQDAYNQCVTAPDANMSSCNAAQATCQKAQNPKRDAPAPAPKGGLVDADVLANVGILNGKRDVPPPPQGSPAPVPAPAPAPANKRDVPPPPPQGPVDPAAPAPAPAKRQDPCQDAYNQCYLPEGSEPQARCSGPCSCSPRQPG